jgi:hypothetical protein
MHHDEKGKIAHAQSKTAKSMRMPSAAEIHAGNMKKTHSAAEGAKAMRSIAKKTKIESGRAKHVGRAAGVKAYTEAGRRLKKFIPQR